MASSNDDSGSHLVVIVVMVLALVLAVVALIIGIVSITNTGGGTQEVIVSSGSSGDYSKNSGGGADRVWQLSFEHTGGPYGYIDDATGEIRGFAVDLATKICQIAGKNCQLVYDSPQRCWDSQEGARAQGGEGLMGGYYDACVGWLKTYDRPRTFKFTQPYAQDISVVFVVKKGNTAFDWTNLTGKTIGFIDGWAYSPLCVSRESDIITGANLSPDQIVLYAGRDELLAGLKKDEVDAIFDNKDGPPALDPDTDIVSPSITACLLSGDSVMTRKDNGLVEWWNEAFNKLTATSEWQAICNDLNDEHGHKPGPRPEDFCIRY